MKRWALGFIVFFLFCMTGCLLGGLVGKKDAAKVDVDELSKGLST